MPNGLGRGLDSLIPKKIITTMPAEALSEVGSALLLNDLDRIVKVAPEKIAINPWQPRQHFADAALHELVESIREHGIIQPLIVTKTNGNYELIAGERRLRSAKVLGLKEVPVIVREASEQKKLEFAIIENLQRENLNPLETAWAYQKLIDEFNISQEDAAKRVGKARSTVANCLRLLLLPDEIKTALAEKKISEAHAKYLLGLDSEAKQINVFRKIVRNNMTVAETDREIKRLGGTKEARVKDFADEDKEKRLAQALNTKINIKRQGKGGKIVIDFYSEGELGDIIDKITN
ncbi:MAG: ParB/RepB/Spo0J family partition protein [Candidatus Falkowbacteria bacterium]